jgi:membrane associated rhomboid family serine protease
MSFNRFGNSFQQSTPIVLNLVIINVLAYFAQFVTSGGMEPNTAADLFALHHYKSDYFKPYQIVTHMFMHGGFFHLFFNMFGLWMFGGIIERSWGPKRFLIFYLVCGLGAGLAQMGSYAYDFRAIDNMVLNPEQYSQYQFMLQSAYTVGASGAVMGLLAAFGYLFPNTQLMIIPIPVPIKAKWAVMGLIAMDVFGGVVSVQRDNIAHFAHLGGALIGFILVLYWNKNNKKSFY